MATYGSRMLCLQGYCSVLRLDCTPGRAAWTSTAQVRDQTSQQAFAADTEQGVESLGTYVNEGAIVAVEQEGGGCHASLGRVHYLGHDLQPWQGCPVVLRLQAPACMCCCLTWCR